MKIGSKANSFASLLCLTVITLTFSYHYLQADFVEQNQGFLGDWNNKDSKVFQRNGGISATTLASHNVAASPSTEVPPSEAINGSALASAINNSSFVSNSSTDFKIDLSVSNTSESSAKNGSAEPFGGRNVTSTLAVTTLPTQPPSAANVPYYLASFEVAKFTEASHKNDVVKSIIEDDFSVTLKDVKEYESLLNCCHSKCFAESTGTTTSKQSCYEKVNNAVAPVRCEIGKTFTLKRRNDTTLLLDDCKPQVISYTCQQLSQSSLPCNKTFQILQYDYHTQYHCLVRIADRVHKRRTTKVPRIHHQVWLYGDKVKFEFHQYISMIATLRYFRPELIFLWNDGYLPSGKWWQEFIGHVNQNASTGRLVYPLEGEALQYGNTRNIKDRTVCLYDVAIVSVVRQKPQTIYGHSFIYHEHQGDVVRLEASLLFGGFYTDIDAIAINNLDPLLNISVSMGEENAQALTNMAILGERYSPHFYAWHYNYVNFVASHWSQNSILNNMALARECPDFVNVDKRMIDPVWDDKHLYDSGDKDLSKNFAVHLYWRAINHDSMQNPLEILKSPHLGPRLFRNEYYLCT